MGGSKEKITEVQPKPVQEPDYTQFIQQLNDYYWSEFPQRYGLGEQQASYIAQALANPQFMTVQETAAQEAIRGRETNRLMEALRTRANLGGGLYGGRAAGTEERAVSEMGQGYAQQDIYNRMMREQALLGLAGQSSIDPMQLASSAETSYQGALQAALANQPSYFYTPAMPSPWAKVVGDVTGKAGEVLFSKYFG